MEQSKQNNLSNVLMWLCILIGFGTVFLTRLKYFSIAGGNDEAMYMYLGKMAAMGKAPYLDYYEMKPPMMFVNYGIAGTLLGFNFFGTHLMSILLLIANTFLFFTFSRHFANKSSAIYGSIIFALLSSSVIIFGPYLQLEHFVLFYLLLATAFLIKYKSTRGLILTGISFACAVLTKQTAVLFLPVLLAVYFTLYTEGTLIQKIKSGLPFIYGGALFTALIVGIVVLWVGFEPLVYWLYYYPAEYTGRNNIASGINLFKTFGSGIYRLNLILVLLSGSAFIASIASNNKTAKIILVMFTTCGVLSIIPGYRFYPQYWILLLPAASFGVVIAGNWLAQKNYGIVAGLIMAMCLVTHVILANNYLFPSKPSELIENTLSGQYFGHLERAAKEAKKIIGKNDKLIVFGGIPQMYLYLDKVAPTRHVWAPMIALNNPKSKIMQEELINDLKTSKPDFIFFSYATFHWTMIDSSSDYVYRSAYNYVTYNYEKVLFLDFATGVITRDQAAQQQERENVLVLYKKR